MSAAEGFMARLRELTERPIGYTVCMPDHGLILRADWLSVEDCWIEQSEASMELGAPGSIVIFESEALADEAAREVGGMAVQVVISSAGQA